MLHEIPYLIALLGLLLLIVSLWVLFRHLTDVFLAWLISCKEKRYTPKAQRGTNNAYNPENDHNN